MTYTVQWYKIPKAQTGLNYLLSIISHSTPPEWLISTLQEMQITDYELDISIRSVIFYNSDDATAFKLRTGL